MKDYCGPGSFTIKTGHRENMNCKRHDEGYVNALYYFFPSEADRKFIEDQAFSEDKVIQMARRFFKLKNGIGLPSAESLSDLLRTATTKVTQFTVDPNGEQTPYFRGSKRIRDKQTPDMAKAKYEFDKAKIRKRLEFDDMEVDDEQPGSGSGQQPSAPESMSLTTTKKGRGQKAHGETETTYIPVTRFNPFDTTCQVLMTYYDFITDPIIAASTSSTGAVQFSFRLNSIYDCRKTYSYAADPSAAADAADGTIKATPTMRNYWMGYYRYWTVVGSRYRFRLRCDTAAANDNQLVAYLYEHGLQVPPTMDTQGTAAVITHQYRRMHPNLKAFKFFDNLPVQTTSGVMPNYNNYWIEFNGTYSPGSIEHEVVEDEYAQIWQTATEVPPTPEIVTLIVQRSPTSGTSVAQPFKVEVTIEYIVQLKDLYSKFQYIEPAADLSAITDFATQTVGGST